MSGHPAWRAVDEVGADSQAAERVEGQMRDLQYMIDVMTAARDGKRIQSRTCPAYNAVAIGEWRDCQVPSGAWPWNWNDVDYRIAPEPKKAREFVVIRCKLNGTLMARDAENDKRFCRTPDCEYINVREVLSE